MKQIMIELRLIAIEAQLKMIDLHHYLFDVPVSSGIQSAEQREYNARIKARQPAILQGIDRFNRHVARETVKAPIRAVNFVTSPVTRPIVGMYRMFHWYSNAPRRRRFRKYVDGGKIRMR